METTESVSDNHFPEPKPGYIAYPIEEFVLSNGDRIQVARTEFSEYTAYYTHLIVQQNHQHHNAVGNWAFVVHRSLDD